MHSGAFKNLTFTPSWVGIATSSVYDGFVIFFGIAFKIEEILANERQLAAYWQEGSPFTWAYGVQTANAHPLYQTPFVNGSQKKLNPA